MMFQDDKTAGPPLVLAITAAFEPGARGRGRLLATAAALGACALLARPAAAETAAAPADATTLGEVVVTAQHVKENSQKTPIAISVYDNKVLKLAAIHDMEGLTAVAPDVNFTMTEGQPIIAVRGVSSRDTNETGNPAVTVNVDGFYLNRPYFLNAVFYDLDRIEVLRGPQGTLNGRNSVGGAINIITAKPVDHFEAYTSLQYGNYNDLVLQGMVNLPLSDKVQLRASAFSESHDGYRANGNEIRGDAADNKSARVEVAFEPFENFHGLVTAQYSRMEGVGDVMQYIPFIFTTTPSGGQALVHDLPAGINAKAFPLGTEPFIDATDKQIRFDLTYDAPGVELKALGGYDKASYRHAVDQTIPGVAAYQWQPSQWPDTYNLELRATSKTPGPLQWQVGAFYFDEKSSLLAGDRSSLPGGGYDYFFGFNYKTKAWSKAVYAQASYELTEKLKLTGGLRYTKDYISETGWFGDLTGGISFSGDQYGSARSSKVTYHAALDYDLTPANLLYAKFDTGYKAGGFNLGATTYGPETVKAYEIGSKNRFFGNTLQLNLAAFYTDYTNQQVSTYTTLVSGQATSLTLNAGASEIYGVEADMIWKYQPIGTFNAAVTYLHARYTDFLSVGDPSDPAASGNVQLKGNRPPQSPTWSLSAGLEHTWDVFGGSLTGRIQTKYQSSSYFSFYNFPDTQQKAYTMSDAFLTWQPDDAKWKVTAFVRNLENSVVFSDAEESQFTGAYGFAFYPPRTYGMRLEYSW